MCARGSYLGTGLVVWDSGIVDLVDSYTGTGMGRCVLFGLVVGGASS